MRVLHVIASADPRHGGPIEGVLRSAEVWRKHGHHRDVVSLDPPDAPFLRSVPIPVTALGVGGEAYSLLRRTFPLLRYGYSPRLVPWLKKQASSYDAVIINGLWNYASVGTWLALRKSAVSYFVFTHGMLDPWFNRAYPVKAFVKQLFWWTLESRVVRDAQCVFFTAEEEMELAKQSFSPLRCRMRVVGYGTRDVLGDRNQQMKAFYSTVPSVGQKPFILFMSRIHEKKGLDLLIVALSRVAKEYPELDMVVAGPDQRGLREKLQQLARTLGVDARVHWAGMLQGDSKWGALHASEALVLPSHQENFGIVVAEAMACGKPLVVTNKVNIWREVSAFGAGYVADDNAQDIEVALRSFLKLTRDERIEMGSRARECFSSHFDLEKISLELLCTIKQENERRVMQVSSTH